MKAPTRIALARVTVECTAPLTIGAGRGDDLLDSICVTDANGLPTIPGTSLAGALRHGVGDPEKAKDLFGYQCDDRGARSRVQVSWAQVHGLDDRPVATRMDHRRADLGEPAQKFLAFLETGVVRDHVRIDACGVADAKGKFDERLVPRGARFTFELRVDGDDAGAELDTLLGALALTTFRVGGRTRKGYGALCVVRTRSRTFDFSEPADVEGWAKLPRALERDVPAGVLPDERTRPPSKPHGAMFGRLTLTPEDFWLFGGGEPVRAAHKRGGKAVAMLPKTESVILWENDRGSVVEGEDMLNLVPATSIKGALRHRTAYHLRRLKKQWADEIPEGQSARADAEADDDLVVLFGDAKKESNEGRSGRVFVSDAYLAPTSRSAGANEPFARDGGIDHVSIDRFTGAPMDGMLFREAPLYRGQIAIDVFVNHLGIRAEARAALRAAVTDLVDAKLALGAGANRGHGFFSGRIQGDLDGWLKNGGDHHGQ